MGIPPTPTGVSLGMVPPTRKSIPLAWAFHSRGHSTHPGKQSIHMGIPPTRASTPPTWVPHPYGYPTHSYEHWHSTHSFEHFTHMLEAFYSGGPRHSIHTHGHGLIGCASSNAITINSSVYTGAGALMDAAAGPAGSAPGSPLRVGMIPSMPTFMPTPATAQGLELLAAAAAVSSSKDPSLAIPTHSQAPSTQWHPCRKNW